MADFTQNITNAVNVFGQGPSTKWGDAVGVPYTMVWGTSNWGEGESLPIAFIKVIQNTQSMAWDVSSLSFIKVIDNSISPSFESDYESLSQGNWNYIFTSDTTDGEERDFASWSETTNGDATFTCQAAAGTSWSES